MGYVAPVLQILLQINNIVYYKFHVAIDSHKMLLLILPTLVSVPKPWLELMKSHNSNVKWWLIFSFILIRGKRKDENVCQNLFHNHINGLFAASYNTSNIEHFFFNF